MKTKTKKTTTTKKINAKGEVTEETTVVEETEYDYQSYQNPWNPPYRLSYGINADNGIQLCSVS